MNKITRSRKNLRHKYSNKLNEKRQHDERISR